MTVGLNRDVVVAVHLCRHNDARKRDPHRLIRSLAYQIAQQLPAFQSALEEDLDLRERTLGGSGETDL